jgi:hypothetical protein
LAHPRHWNGRKSSWPHPVSRRCGETSARETFGAEKSEISRNLATPGAAERPRWSCVTTSSATHRHARSARQVRGAPCRRASHARRFGEPDSVPSLLRNVSETQHRCSPRKEHDRKEPPTVLFCDRRT